MEVNIQIVPLIAIGLLFLVIVVLAHRTDKLEKNYGKTAKPAPAIEKKPIRIAQNLPYHLKTNVLTKSEQKLYEALKPIIEKNNLVVFPKVRLADFIYCPKNTNDSYAWFNKIRAKHIDFLICNSNTEPLLAVELDDEYHETAAAVERDMFIDDVYRKVRLEILHLRNYDEEDLESMVVERIFPTGLEITAAG